MNKPYIHGMLPDVSEPAPSAKAPKAEEPQIRYLGDMQRLQPQPGDVFVLTCEQRISDDTAARIRQMVSATLNGAKVLVLGDGMKLGVVAQPSPTTHVVVKNTVGEVASANATIILSAMQRAQRNAGRNVS